jgi:DNA-binding PadR family transcriptional regulator
MALNVFAGFVELHVLYHASRGAIYGLWLIEELRRHGYKISPGTLYPLLHSMTASDLLVVREVLTNGKMRKYYSLTAKGQRHLQRARRQLTELVWEIFDDRDLRLLFSPGPQKRSRTASGS